MARGDLGALAELYDRFATVAYGLALAVLEDRSLAEDAVKEGFLDAWQGARGFSPQEGSVAAWLLVRVHRRAIARARDASHVADRDRRDLTPSGLYALLAPLPREEREVIALAYVGGRTRSELAAITGVPADEIGKRMFSGLRRLGEPSLATVAEGEVRLVIDRPRCRGDDLEARAHAPSAA